MSGMWNIWCLWRLGKEMTDTCYVVVRDPETNECYEYYNFDIRDEAKGFMKGLRTANDRYIKLLVNITWEEPIDD